MQFRAIIRVAILPRNYGVAILYPPSPPPLQFSKRLAAFCANAKFELPEEGRTLAKTVKEMRDDFGLRSVYCWHTLGGYWGGVSTTSPDTAHLSPTQRRAAPTASLLDVEPALSWDAGSVCGVGVVTPDATEGLMRGIHSYLAESGVDGVKIDAQSGLSSFGRGLGGGPHMVRRYVQAMEASVKEHFEG